jgi:hypothetical protein
MGVGGSAPAMWVLAGRTKEACVHPAAVEVLHCLDRGRRRRDRARFDAASAEAVRPKYWEPRSVWNTTPRTLPPRVATAIFRASATRSLRICALAGQPSTRRENRSITVGRNNHPSPVRR